MADLQLLDGVGFPLVEEAGHAGPVVRREQRAELPGHAIDDPAFLQPARGMNAIGG